ncbi:hypothetical protein [Zavarzinella formosa]|uniref:hypothetical protein n=1 Tax=Zavarzinella formosa TaxID=360055 RepID=UPI0002D9BCB2|nr:hypothetical protein [Zavarzinella formosa]
MSEADDETIHCDRHGPAKMAFVCQHLVGGSGLGFWCTDNGPYPDAWCGDCDDLMMQTGEWTEEAEKIAGIRVICHHCYVNIRRRNRVRREKPSP